MNAREPDEAAMRQARDDQEEADAARAAGAHPAWQEQGSEIEQGMADAVDRAAAMGDRVEPSTLPPERRPEADVGDDDPEVDAEKPAR